MPIQNSMEIVIHAEVYTEWFPKYAVYGNRFPSLLLVAAASAQIKVNQTNGFGKDQLLTFTYGQNFSCIHQPFDDWTTNAKVAGGDPDEFQPAPLRKWDASQRLPHGEPVKEVVKLYVITRSFETERARARVYS